MTTSILSNTPPPPTSSGKKRKVSYDPADYLDDEHPTVIDKIATFIERFVWLQDPSLYRLISLWIIATHRYQLFDYAGYIFAYSSEPSSGKSRLLEVIDRLVYNSSGIITSPTEAVVFRTAFDATQIVDELDSLMNLDYLKSVLNSGFQKGSQVLRMVQIKNKYVAQDFPIYAPRALAGISKDILSQTTLDRSFPTHMVRQTKQEKREKFRPRKLKNQIARLRYDIEMFWIHNEERAAEIYNDDNSFPYLEKFRDRTVDIAEPLAAVLEAVYLDHSQHAPPEGALEADRLNLITAISITREDQVKEFLQHRILQALAQIAKKENPLIGSPTELAARCSRLSDQPTEYDISAALRLYGFRSKSVRMDGAPKYRYVLESKELVDIVKRYVRGK